MENLLFNYKNLILFDLLSCISIETVDVKKNFDNSLNIYIKTKNLQNIDLNKIKSIEKTFSNKKILVSILIPKKIQIRGNLFKENKNLVCLYLEKV